MQTTRRRRGVGRYVAAALLTIITSTTASTPAHAKSEAPSVNTITVKKNHSTITLDFDSPITQAQADEEKNKLNREPAAQQSNQFTQMLSTQVYYPMVCQEIHYNSDNNGELSIARNCPYHNMPWGWLFSSTAKSIISGAVTENGMRYWVNGASRTKNPGHVVDETYHFHGTLSGIYANNHVDYQDYFTFRHNVYTGGTGSITIAGSETMSSASS